MFVKIIFCNAARAVIRALILKITSVVFVTFARRFVSNRYFFRVILGFGICSLLSGTRVWRIS